MFLNKKNCIEILEQKKFWWFLFNPKALTKYNLNKVLKKSSSLILLNYPIINRKLIRYSFLQSRIIGVGTPTYYTFGVSKWQKLLNNNKYQLKLSGKKDSWFFFGIVISMRNWFLNSTFIIWNVFYNEIIEKTFFLFNTWNVLIQSISVNSVKQSFFKKWLKKKAKLFFLWKLPRIYSKFILLT